LVGKPEKRRLLRRLRHRWEDNIRMALEEINLKLCSGFICLRIGTSGGLL
jgi:hypothetical protein